MKNQLFTTRKGWRPFLQTTATRLFMNCYFKLFRKNDRGRYMRKALYSLLLALTCGFLSAKGQFSQLTEKITLNMHHATAQQLIEETDRQSRYAFLFAPELLTRIPVEHFEAKGTPLGELLVLLQKKYGLLFSIADGNIAVKPAPKPDNKPAAQVAPKKNPGRITGRIIDEDNGQPVAGATVSIGNKGTTADMDGVFSLSLPAGSYMATVSSVGYGTKEVTEIEVKDNLTVQLDITLKREKGQLSEVVVKASARKESVAALYIRQKSDVNITNGISAEQIARTPDNNVGQILKRISGVATFDNKYVIVRGISERYNTAILDGTNLPSTDMSRRNFNFDLIPTEMIDNVTVVKTITPDLTSGFGGGLIQVNTKDIPDQNFTSFSAGIGFNDRTTGKEFLSTERGKYDYLGFDDGHRNFPEGIAVTEGNPGTRPFTSDPTTQSLRFRNNFPVYRYIAAPNQNYSFTLGRAYAVGKNNQKLGMMASLSYRNTQSTSEIINQRGKFDGAGGTLERPSGYGNQYNFNTTWGGLLNLAYKTKKHQLSSRNLYTRIFNNPFYTLWGYNHDGSNDLSLPPDTRRYSYEPDFMGLLQNKLMGRHQFGKLSVNWDLARTSIRHDMKDQLRRETGLVSTGYPGFYSELYVADPGLYPLSRSIYKLKATDYNWQVSVAHPLSKGIFNGTIKLGYIGSHREQRFDWLSAVLKAINRGTFPPALVNLPLEILYQPENFGTLFNYQVYTGHYNYYDGTSSFHAGYAMLDQKILGKFRLTGGVRIEYFNLDLLNNPENETSTFIPPGYTLINDSPLDKKWQFLPSVNFTWNVTGKTNIRVAYSQSMVRPEFNERSLFTRPDPVLQAAIQGQKITSTKFSHYDLRIEYYPRPGEVLSLGLLYKYIDRPLELERRTPSLYVYANSYWAHNYGLEAEIRKQLGFIMPAGKFWNRLTFFSNVTLIKSSVQTSFVPAGNYRVVDPVLKLVEATAVLRHDKRPLYGQTPLLINAGISYDAELFGLNLVYNYTGRKFYSVGENIAVSEFEAPLDRIDLQLSYAILHKKGMLRLNMANLLDKRNIFYFNGGYKTGGGPNGGNVVVGGRPAGYTDNFNEEEGDLLTFSQRTGRTFSLSFSYTIK